MVLLVPLYIGIKLFVVLLVPLYIVLSLYVVLLVLFISSGFFDTSILMDGCFYKHLVSSVGSHEGKKELAIFHIIEVAIFGQR